MEPRTVALLALFLEIAGVLFFSAYPPWPRPGYLVIQGASEIAEFLNDSHKFLWWVGPLLLIAGFWMQYRAIIISNPSR